MLRVSPSRLSRRKELKSGFGPHVPHWASDIDHVSPQCSCQICPNCCCFFFFSRTIKYAFSSGFKCRRTAELMIQNTWHLLLMQCHLKHHHCQSELPVLDYYRGVNTISIFHFLNITTIISCYMAAPLMWIKLSNLSYARWQFAPSQPHSGHGHHQTVGRESVEE